MVGHGGCGGEVGSTVHGRASDGVDRSPMAGGVPTVRRPYILSCFSHQEVSILSVEKFTKYARNSIKGMADPIIHTYGGWPFETIFWDTTN